MSYVERLTHIIEIDVVLYCSKKEYLNCLACLLRKVEVIFPCALVDIHRKVLSLKAIDHCMNCFVEIIRALTFGKLDVDPFVMASVNACQVRFAVTAH